MNTLMLYDQNILVWLQKLMADKKKNSAALHYITWQYTANYDECTQTWTKIK